MQEVRHPGVSVVCPMLFPWVLYAAVLSILALAERCATQEAVGADRILDTTLTSVAFIGLVAPAARSAGTARRRLPSAPRGAFFAGLLAGGLIGSLAGAVVVTGMWTVFAPVLGFLCVVCSFRHGADGAREGRGRRVCTHMNRTI